MIPRHDGIFTPDAQNLFILIIFIAQYAHSKIRHFVYITDSAVDSENSFFLLKIIKIFVHACRFPFSSQFLLTLYLRLGKYAQFQ